MTKLYVVIVHNPKGSLRDDRSHSCWTGSDKAALIKKGFYFKEKWERNGQYGPYEVVIGEIYEKAIVPVKYRIVKYILDGD